ncbi:PREDICTED: uncharacterized protein LOC104729307 [Camelina sativa]|uniref:Uncharacterized protein LOC104729307 n=1 Tax=Camelina sativa TaxID=90675 RepID=A0ABM0UUH4_CAMSA|nr:PREDICTED: uncharacterized protein LOC104729307 [Camelina sativa]
MANKKPRCIPPEERNMCVGVVCMLLFIVLFCWGVYVSDPRNSPHITIASMNFTITENSTSAKWDLLIRTPPSLPGDYICLEGDLQVFLIYKHVIVATSPPQRYQNLQPHWPHLLRVSVVASENDINGVAGKNVFDDIVKERSEVRFASRFVFPDCREDTTGTMSFVCDEVVLRFDSSSWTMATTKSKNPTCVYHATSIDHYLKKVMV